MFFSFSNKNSKIQTLVLYDRKYLFLFEVIVPQSGVHTDSIKSDKEDMEKFKSPLQEAYSTVSVRAESLNLKSIDEFDT